MYLLAKFSGHRSYGNGDINSYINSYMNISEKAERTAQPPILRHFQNQETDLQFRSPRHGWQKNDKKKNTQF